MSVMAVCVWAAAPLLFLGLCLCSVGGQAHGEALEFGGVSSQWGRFPVWNACCESVLSFSLRTHSQEGLLLYLDDEGFCDFLELLLLHGHLRLRFSIFCAEPAELQSGVAVSDGHWHAVRVKRDWRNTSLEVDGRLEGWAEVKSKRRDMTVFSHTYIGGGDTRTTLLATAPHITFGTGTPRLPWLDHGCEHQRHTSDVGELRGRHSNSWLWAGPPVPERRGVQRSQRPGRMQLFQHWFPRERLQRR
ncbi:hypothetical protein PBY51_001864 [Eleginops maclovinus]|uniref:Laminin G domain-containing protein n=1 Tax=Eleginops maclovinus TaxID=56733 RepID=A0AAN8ACR9_ELEMC|nr:hypothetical protein PBY51_001864 [Eleginops maclovinus]